jgi:hypothetical protein
MDMAFFLIGRGADSALQLLSVNTFDSRQDAMAELSRITSDSAFAQWELEVFVIDLDAGVPVLLVRPQRGEEGESVVVAAAEDAGSLPDEADQDAEASEQDVAAEEAESVVEAEPIALADVAGEMRGDLREALKRTAEQMSSEGIVPPPSAGLEPESAPQDSAEPSAEDAESAVEALEGDADADTRDLLGEAPEEDTPQAADSEAPAPEAVDAVAEVTSQPEADVTEEQSWPWDAPPAAPAVEPGVSPEIATVYEGLEQMEDQEAAPEGQAAVSEGTPLQAEGSDFILDLDAIQPVAMEPQGTDAAGPPTKPVEDKSADAVGEEQPDVPVGMSAEATAAESQASDDSSPTTSDEAAEAPTESPVEAPDFPSAMTDYTCEDCVYVETCPNRDQRAPKDCGSFQWK